MSKGMYNMSKYIWRTDLYEVTVDADGEFVELYEQWLPHHEMIAEKICASWNEMHMEQYFDDVLKGNIQSAVMRCIQEKDSDYSVAEVIITGVPGFRFSRKRIGMIDEQLVAQMADGWGEGFFHKLFTAPDGTLFYVE